MPKKTTKKAEPELLVDEAAEEPVEETESVEEESDSFIPELSNLNMVLISGFGIALLVIMIMLVNGSGQSVEAALSESSTPVQETTIGDVIDADGIERKGEGRHFYTTIKIPPGAETLYLSGSGAARNEDGSWVIWRHRLSIPLPVSRKSWKRRAGRSQISCKCALLRWLMNTACWISTALTVATVSSSVPKTIQ